jgi:hypothetical protein
MMNSLFALCARALRSLRCVALRAVLCVLLLLLLLGPLCAVRRAAMRCLEPGIAVES